MSSSPSENSRVVCAVAFTCQPDLGSEYEVGWRWTIAAGQSRRVLVLTRRASYTAIPVEEKEDCIFGLVKDCGGTSYKSIDLPLADKVFRGRRLMRTHYLLWQMLAASWIRAHREQFCLLHHVCFVAAWLPPITFFSGLPFIWGPIGTGGPLPKWAQAGIAPRLWNFVTQKTVRFNPLIHHIVSKSELVIPINSHVAQLIRASNASRTVIFPAIAYDRTSHLKTASFRPIAQATIIYSGRLVPFKMPALAQRVGEILTQNYPGLRFIMIGEGISRLRTERSNLYLMEAVEQTAFFKMLDSAQLLLFPTTEGSGFVALEALARGVPVVTTCGSGPAGFVGTDGGIVVDLESSLEATARRLAEGCEHVLCDALTWQQYSLGALRRADLFNWRKLESMLAREYARLHERVN